MFVSTAPAVICNVQERQFFERGLGAQLFWVLADFSPETRRDQRLARSRLRTL